MVGWTKWFLHTSVTDEMAEIELSHYSDSLRLRGFSEAGQTYSDARLLSTDRMDLISVSIQYSVSHAIVQISGRGCVRIANIFNLWDRTFCMWGEPA